MEKVENVYIDKLGRSLMRGGRQTSRVKTTQKPKKKISFSDFFKLADTGHGFKKKELIGRCHIEIYNFSF